MYAYNTLKMWELYQKQPEFIYVKYIYQFLFGYVLLEYTLLFQIILFKVVITDKNNQKTFVLFLMFQESFAREGGVYKGNQMFHLSRILDKLICSYVRYWSWGN